MKKHEILSAQTRAALFNPPTDPATIIKYYTLSEEDLALLRKRRRPENRLGFAVHMAYMRYPGRVLEHDETPPEELLGFIAEQLAIAPKVFQRYAQRDETRREHISELQSYLGVRSFQASDLRGLSKAAVVEANGTEKGDAIVAAMLTWLQQKRILLPATAVIERIALAARATARQQAYKALIAGLDASCKTALEALLIVKEDEKTSPFAWLRQWQEMPKLKNLAGILERLNTVRKLGIEPNREQRIHRARYMAIVKEVSIMDTQHLSRQDEARRLASLIVFARETEARLIDAALAMADKMVGQVFRSAEKSHKDHLAERAKVLKKTSRTLLKLAKTVLAAHETGGDTDRAIEKNIGWDTLAEVVKSAEAAIQATRDDSMADVLEHHASIRRLAPLLLDNFTFCAATSDDQLLAALEAMREMYVSHRKAAILQEKLSVSFLQSKWKKLVRQAVMSSLWENNKELKLKRLGHFRGFTLMCSFSGREGETPRLYLRGKHTYEANLNTENPFGTIASIEYALRRLDKDAEEEKAKCERMEKALADYREQLNRPFEHEERLRALCLKQQEINKLLDLDKGDAQAVANDNVPQDEQAADTFVERLTTRRTERRQVKDFEGVA